MEQPWRSRLLRVRAARGRDRLRRRKALRRVRRGFGVASTRACCTRSALGGTQHWAVPVPTSNDIFMQRQAQPADRARREPLPDGLEHARRAGSSYASTRATGARRLEVLPVACEWNVSAERRARWVGLLFAEPWLLRRGQSCRRRPLDVLRRLDHRPADGDPRTARSSSPATGRTSASRARFRGWNAVTGALSFQVELPTGDSGFQIVFTRPRVLG